MNRVDSNDGLYGGNGELKVKEYYSKLPTDKIKINWNKNPVKMELFLSFLTVDVERSIDHLGSCTGWTKLTGANGLEIGGGKVNGVEYLDSLKYGQRLDNPYNNYVNPFYLFEVLTDEGKQFFIEYYAEDIKETLKQAMKLISKSKRALERAKEDERALFEFWTSHDNTLTI